MLLLSLTLALASVEPVAPPSPAVRSVDECHALFGSADVRAALVEKRTHDIEAVTVKRQGVTLVHHVGRWQDAPLMRMPGITVVTVDLEAKTATLDVENAACPTGRYQVPLDTALGATSRVVGAIDDGLFVESNERLAFVPATGRARPSIDLVWQSPFTVEIDTTKPAIGTASGASGTRRPPPKLASSVTPPPGAAAPPQSVEERAAARAQKRDEAKARARDAGGR